MKQKTILNIAAVKAESIVDGPGFRFTIFAQGCPRRCSGCHNPQTWPFEGGQQMEAAALFQLVLDNPLCKGVTLTGGEPFEQAEAFAVLAAHLQQAGYEVCAYSGYTFEELLNGSPAQRDLLHSIDVLVDGPFLLEERSFERSFRGSRNQRILNAAASIKEQQAVLESSPRWNGEYT